MAPPTISARDCPVASGGEDEFLSPGVPIELEAFGMSRNPDLPDGSIGANHEFGRGVLKFDGESSSVEIGLKFAVFGGCVEPLIKVMQGFAGVGLKFLVVHELLR